MQLTVALSNKIRCASVLSLLLVLGYPAFYKNVCLPFCYCCVTYALIDFF